MSSDDSDECTIVFRRISGQPSLLPREKRELRAFARTLASRVGDGHPFTCLITGDKEVQRLNRTFLTHDYPTDVLSFPSSDPSACLGDLAISAQRAGAQAEIFGHARIDEIRILMLHGFLHLIGMDHERDRGEMARAERKWRTDLRLPVTLLARTSRARKASSR